MDILKCRNRILYIFVLKIQGIFLMFLHLYVIMYIGYVLIILIRRKEE